MNDMLEKKEGFINIYNFIIYNFVKKLLLYINK